MTAQGQSKRYAVIDEQQSIAGRVVVGPTVVADAVTGTELSIPRKSYGNSRSEISKAVLPAEPIGDNADLVLNRLFIAEERPSFGPAKLLACETTPYGPKVKRGP